MKVYDLDKEIEFKFVGFFFERYQFYAPTVGEPVGVEPFCPIDQLK